MEPGRIAGLLVNRAAAAAAPTTTSATDQFLDLISNPFKNEIQDNAVYASLATSLAMTGIVALIFCFIRPLNSTVYAPRLTYADEKHAPPAIGKSPWAWFGPVLKTKEQLLVEKVGLDATIFIRFTKMCRNIFLVLSLMGMGVVIPVNVVGGDLQFGKDVSGVFNKMTPQYMQGNIFWAFVGVAYAIALTCCFFLWLNYRAVVRLRRAYFESPEYQGSLHARTLMVVDIPKTLRTDEGVVRIVDGIKSMQDTPRGAIARNVKELPDLIEEHEELVEKLEKILAKYLKNPNKLPATRPTTEASKKDDSYVKGQKVDAIVYLTKRIQDLETRIKLVRESVDQRNAMPYGFASYESVEDAHSVAYAGKRKKPQGARVKLAPRPSDIIWTNLSLNKKAMSSKKWIGYFYVAILMVVWTCINALLAVFVSNLSNLGLVWGAFNTQLHKNPKLWSIVQGIASPALTSCFYYCLPIIFRRLSIQAGDITKTSRERHVIHKLYAFFIFNNLIVFSVFGAVWAYIAAVVEAKQGDDNVLQAIKDGDIWAKAFAALCQVSPFWITWLLQRNLGAAIDLAQVANLGWGSFARRFLTPTPRQLIRYTAPPPFDYASYYNYFLFYATVALTFAPFQPLVLVVTALYFVLDSWLKKYLILYVFITKNESGGQYWRVLYNRVLFAVFLSTLSIAFIIVAKVYNYWIMLASLGPLPFLLIAFKIYCKRTFDDQIHYYTQGLAGKDGATMPDTVSRKSNNVSIRFGHPALYKPLMTPMVSAKSQHLLAEVYSGRLDDDDASIAEYAGAYGMRDMHRSGRPGSKKQQQGPFEFVKDSDINFENFKNREDFRGDFGGEGELYGKAEDIIRTATPASIREANARRFQDHSRSASRGSDIAGDAGDAGGTTYPAGYHNTPTALREHSPSPDRGRYNSRNFSSHHDDHDRSRSHSQNNLVRNAAPMGFAGEYRGVSAGTLPGSRPRVGSQGPAHPGTYNTHSEVNTPEYEMTSYDYFRGRK